MRYFSVAALLLIASAGRPARAQEVDVWMRVHHIVVPQTRSFRMSPAHQPIRIEKVTATVRVLEQAATTTLDVFLANPSPRPSEAVLLLPVPDGAAVHAFDFQGGGREPSAQLLPKAEARRIYNSIVAKTKDPALLEFAGYNLVRSSVFPVPANGAQRIRLTYNHLLDADKNRIDYILPRSEALDISIPWEVSVDIRAKSPVATVYSPSHELVVKRHEPRHLTVTTREQGRMDPGPFRLSWLMERNGLSASLFAYPDPKIGGGYFLLLAGLPDRSAEARNRIRREVTLVIDRSGSMAGGAMDQVKAAAIQIIEGLAPDEYFNIIDYSNAVALFGSKPVKRNGETVKRARAYLQALRPTGGTNIHDALVEALRQEPIAGTLPIVLFLTDGLPTIGRTSEVTIRDLVEKGNPHGRRVFTFGVGHDVNVPLLDRIAETSRAVPTYVSPGEDVELKVARVFRRLYGPVVAGGKIETLDKEGALTTQAVRELMPAELPDLFEGDQLVLLGQYRGEGPITFKLTGNYLGNRKSFQFPFDFKASTTRNAFVPRLWATRRIAFLVDQIRLAGAAVGGRPAVVGETVFNDPKLRELTDEILRLSTEFGVLSEYTAFLAREGTNLTDWDRLTVACNERIDKNAVRMRWGQAAVAQGRNFESFKKQARVNLRNAQLDHNLNRVEIVGALTQSADRGLFFRDNQWIDGKIVAGRLAVKADTVVHFGTPQFKLLLDDLIKNGQQALIARGGEVLLRHKDKNVLVKYDFQGK